MDNVYTLMRSMSRRRAFFNVNYDGTGGSTANIFHSRISIEVGDELLRKFPNRQIRSNLSLVGHGSEVKWTKHLFDLTDAQKAMILLSLDNHHQQLLR